MDPATNLQPLPDDVELAAAFAVGVFGKRGLNSWAYGSGGLFARALLPLPRASAIGVALTGLGVFFSLTNAGGVFSLLSGLGGPRLLDRFALHLLGLSRPLRQLRASESAHDSQRADAHDGFSQFSL